MMKQDSRVVCRLNRGGKVTVQLDDRVEIDRSAGQYEPGWWVCVPEWENSDYFLSDEGVLYAPDWTRAQFAVYDQPVGICVPMAKQAKAYDKMIEALYEDEGFSCGTQLDT